jgi:hypothetical protein
MADAQGNVLHAPASSSKARVDDPELLYSYNPPPTKKGCTLKPGQGLLLLGTPLRQLTDGSKQFVAATEDTVQTAAITFTASSDLVTYPAAHNLAVGDEVSFAGVTGTGGSIVAGTTYFVKTAPSGTTATLSATSGGATLDITADGTATGSTESELGGGAIGFLYTSVDTGASTDAPHQGNIILGGVLKYSLIKAAIGGVDLPADVVSTLNATINTVYGFLKF